MNRRQNASAEGGKQGDFRELPGWSSDAGERAGGGPGRIADGVRLDTSNSKRRLKPVPSSQAVAVLIDPELVAAAARAENFRNCHGRHRHAIGCPLGFQPVAGSLLDHEIDEFEPLGIVGRFGQ
ncbi:MULTISPECIES: hypothetical protein [unclassified Bradyrhizobium]|uniref:hypothetical protein n=1 Tax=unclassified Bradyrhizobium TaxID=2631580 RepID=UPI001BAD0EFA|nr:hypothetical protein [Bradyrhizobium sp. AUGA SZCCT0176]MBR1232920.1 hypothetical protein [Bradyrhizobium sp. AUGA SZCCT0182]MBR1298639.1 hypothetical protein [Bradyrhizobium sp. AUGA SZCCT0042]